MSRLQARRAVPGLAAVAALLLSSCADPAPELVRDPQPVEEALPEVETSPLMLPTQYEQLDVLDTGWDLPAQYADGVYLSATTHEAFLEFTAVDIHGDVLWSAQRAPVDSEFVLTTDDRGRALAVLTDTQDVDGTATTTATAYDLHTGDEVWGPVEVPGPPAAPGLVFAAADASGDPELRDGTPTALGPTTGQEADTGLAGARPLGEYHGVLLLVHEEVLVAQDLVADKELWRLPLSEHGWSADALEARRDPALGEHGLALLTTSESSQALIDVRAGTVVSDTARDAAFDGVTSTTVVLDDTGLHASDPAGQPLWSLSTAPQTTIAAAGQVMLYLREEETVRVHNVVTGAVATAYDPDDSGVVTVPLHITAFGAALLTEGERQLLAAVPDQEPPEVTPPEE